MSDQDYINLISGSYLIAASFFGVGLMLLRSPATARNGNRLAALAMLIAAGVTLIDRNILEFEFIGGGVLLGAVIGVVMARTVQMTAMPQMVAIFNAFGGGASALLAGSEFIRLADNGDVPENVGATIMLGTAIGALTLTGSIVAAGKLTGFVTQNPIVFPLRNVVSSILAFWSVFMLLAYTVPVFYGIVIGLAQGLLAMSTPALIGIDLFYPPGWLTWFCEKFLNPRNAVEVD